MGLLDAERSADKPVDKDTFYRCPKCPYKTKQRRGLPEVMHRCSAGRTPTMTTLKEDK